MKFSERTKMDYSIAIVLFGYTFEQIKLNIKFNKIYSKYEKTKRDSFSGWELASQLEDLENDANYVEKIPLTSYNMTSAFRALEYMSKRGYNFIISSDGLYNCKLYNKQKVEEVSMYSGDLGYVICSAIYSILEKNGDLKDLDIDDFNIEDIS